MIFNSEINRREKKQISKARWINVLLHRVASLLKGKVFVPSGMSQRQPNSKHNDRVSFQPLLPLVIVSVSHLFEFCQINLHRKNLFELISCSLPVIPLTLIWTAIISYLPTSGVFSPFGDLNIFEEQGNIWVFIFLFSSLMELLFKRKLSTRPENRSSNQFEFWEGEEKEPVASNHLEQSQIYCAIHPILSLCTVTELSSLQKTTEHPHWFTWLFGDLTK